MSMREDIQRLVGVGIIICVFLLGWAIADAASPNTKPWYEISNSDYLSLIDGRNACNHHMHWVTKHGVEHRLFNKGFDKKCSELDRRFNAWVNSATRHDKELSQKADLNSITQALHDTQDYK